MSVEIDSVEYTPSNYRLFNNWGVGDNWDGYPYALIDVVAIPYPNGTTADIRAEFFRHDESIVSIFAANEPGTTSYEAYESAANQYNKSFDANWTVDRSTLALLMFADNNDINWNEYGATQSAIKFVSPSGGVLKTFYDMYESGTVNIGFNYTGSSTAENWAAVLVGPV